MNNFEYRRLMKEYGGMIFTIVREHLYVTRHTNVITKEDLVSAATYGLIKGYNTYDPTKSSLSTHLYNNIKGWVKITIRDILKLDNKSVSDIDFDSDAGGRDDPNISYDVNDYTSDFCESDGAFYTNESYDKLAMRLIDRLYKDDVVTNSVLKSKLGIIEKKTDETLADEFNTTVSAVRWKFKKGIEQMKLEAPNLNIG